MKKDPELLAYVRRLPCIICGRRPSDPHHVKPRGSGGEDVAHNVMAICRHHHSVAHSLPLTLFAQHYPIVRVWLEDHGWEIDDFLKRWVPPRIDYQ